MPTKLAALPALVVVLVDGLAGSSWHSAFVPKIGFDDYDIATQILFSHHYWAVDGQLEVFSAPYRYVWPSGLDLMARPPE